MCRPHLLYAVVLLLQDVSLLPNSLQWPTPLLFDRRWRRELWSEEEVEEEERQKKEMRSRTFRTEHSSSRRMPCSTLASRNLVCSWRVEN